MSQYVCKFRGEIFSPNLDSANHGACSRTVFFFQLSAFLFTSPHAGGLLVISWIAIENLYLTPFFRQLSHAYMLKVLLEFV